MNNTDNYIPYGEEWEKEMMKLPKKTIIELFRMSKTEWAEKEENVLIVLTPSNEPGK